MNKPFLGPRTAGRCAALAAAAALTGCLATAPKLGDDKGTVTGAAGGAATDNKNKALEHCDETLGTLALHEDVNAPWYVELRNYQLGSTLPVIRLMVQQSNCFVVVERGLAMASLGQERSLQSSGEMRSGSNFGKGQMVAADYTLSPSIQFSAKTGGGGGAVGALLGPVAGFVASSMTKNSASTTLLLIDNRSSVQISAAEGSASNMDFGVLGGALLPGLGAGGGAYAKTPEGKVIMAAFADSFNQMVKALRNYRAQTVKGGLGTGGRLAVDGASSGPTLDTSPTQPSANRTTGNAPAKGTAGRPAAAKPAAVTRPSRAASGVQ